MLTTGHWVVVAGHWVVLGGHWVTIVGHWVGTGRVVTWAESGFAATTRNRMRNDRPLAMRPRVIVGATRCSSGSAGCKARVVEGWD